MVVGFPRSISLPGSTRPTSDKSYHVRSISLPSRSHPLISHLEDEIRSVKSWQSSEPESESSAWLCDGLSRLEILHTSLRDFLRLPRTQESLHHESRWTGRVLDDFLRFADAHGTFRYEVVAMNDHQSDAQVTMRWKDDAKLASCIRCMKKAEKELANLAASLREVSKPPPATRFTNGIEEAELAGIIREVINVTVSGSAAIFMGIVAVSSAASAAIASFSTKSSWMLSRKRSTEGEAMEKLQGLEECIRAVESRSERVFRCLVNTRVTLLGMLTPSL